LEEAIRVREQATRGDIAPAEEKIALAQQRLGQVVDEAVDIGINLSTIQAVSTIAVHAPTERIPTITTASDISGLARETGHLRRQVLLEQLAKAAAVPDDLEALAQAP